MKKYTDTSECCYAVGQPALLTIRFVFQFSTGNIFFEAVKTPHQPAIQPDTGIQYPFGNFAACLVCHF